MIDFDTIRELREQRQWTQEQMAEKLGLTRNGYAKIETGKSTPSLERLDEIAGILGVKVIELLKLENKALIVQTQNYEANYYQNYQNHEKSQIQIDKLNGEIEKLNLVITHKDELLKQKDEYIRVLKRLIDKDIEVLDEL